jgi:hypothetical protein
MVPLLLVAACGFPGGDEFVSSGVTWDPENVVVASGALYLRLPTAGAVVRIAPGEEAKRLDLGEGRVTRVSGSPDGSRIVAFLEQYKCVFDEDDDVQHVDNVEDCPPDSLVVETSLKVINGTDVADTLPVAGTYNAIAFSDDGSYGIAYVDFEQNIVVDGVLNLTGVVALDLNTGARTVVPVGFAADRVLFTNEGGASTTKAVVLSRNEVAVVDLVAQPPSVEVTFPLTLDPDDPVEPTSVDLTPDGRYALISTLGSSDLYALDLEQHAINIVELAESPADLQVWDAHDRTVLVYSNRPVVELLDHTFFDVESFDLDESMTDVVLSGDNAVLFSTGNQHDLYRFDFSDQDVIEYRLQNPAVSVHVAPTGEYALALTRAEGSSGQGVDALYDLNPGMEIIDLRSDDSEAFLLEGQGLGVAYSSDESSLAALVLQEDIDYLYRLDLYTRDAREIELSAPPVAIGSLPDGTFWITHDAGLGLVTFLDSEGDVVSEVGGFATLGFFDPIEVIDEEETP